MHSKITPETSRKFTRPSQLAERLGLTTRTLFRWADEGKIARYKVNPRVVLFDEADVIAHIEAGKVVSPGLSKAA